MNDNRYGFCINTLSMNPSFTVVYDKDLNLKPGTRNICDGYGIHGPTGGVCISYHLKKMGIKTDAFGFEGGLFGRLMLEFLKDNGIGTKFVHTNHETVLSTVTREIKGYITTQLDYVSGEEITMDEYFTLTKMMRECEDVPEYFVLSGTYPDCLVFAIYPDLIDMLHQQNIKVVTDFSGADVRLAVRQHPEFIVVGKDELYDLLFYEIDTLPSAMAALKRLSAETGQTFLCTLGHRGAVYSAKDMMCSCILKRNKTENPYARSAFIASFLKGYEFSCHDVEYALKYAVSYSSAIKKNGEEPEFDKVYKNFNNLNYTRYF